MASLTPEAIEKAVNGKRATLEPWTRQTRHDTAVGPRKDDPPRLPAWTEPFGLWESVQYQAVPRRHMEGIKA